MVCDRACNALIFFTLATLYKEPYASFSFLMCFILDFGSHWLQFQSSAFVKSESHKGKNKRENWLVGLYYNNLTVFKITCIGAEVGAVMLFLNAKWKAVQNLLIWKIALIVMSSILAFKMFVNVF